MRITHGFQIKKKRPNTRNVTWHASWPLPDQWKQCLYNSHQPFFLPWFWPQTCQHASSNCLLLLSPLKRNKHFFFQDLTIKPNFNTGSSEFLSKWVQGRDEKKRFKTNLETVPNERNALTVDIEAIAVCTRLFCKTFAQWTTQWGRNICFNTFGGRSQNVCDQAVKNGRVIFVLIWCMVWSGLYCKTEENIVRGKPKKFFVTDIWNFANVQVVALFWDVVNAKKQKFVGEKWN